MADQRTTPVPVPAAAVQEFYEAYWARVREDTWNEADRDVVRALVGRFEHHVTFCPDGVLIVLEHASADSFIWAETSQGVLEVAEESFDSRRAWIDLEVGKLLPGQPSYLGFDLDVACRTDVEEAPTLRFDRLQIRYVPFSFDPEFWSPANAVELAKRNLKGCAF